MQCEGAGGSCAGELLSWLFYICSARYGLAAWGSDVPWRGSGGQKGSQATGATAPRVSPPPPSAPEQTAPAAGHWLLCSYAKIHSIS